MQCNEFEQILEQESDGALPPAAALHLKDCAGCAALWEDFQAIRQAGGELGAQEPEPPERVWAALRMQLEAEGLVRDSAPASAPASAGWLSGWFGRAPRPVLACSCLAVLLVAVFLSDYNRGWTVAEFPSGANSAVAAASLTPSGLDATLDGNIKRVMASLPAGDVALADSFEHNLGIVDDLIEGCKKSVREQPNNPMAREYLYGAYQQKAVLLATAMDRSTLEDR
jgi:hypothetical protein